ncbi:hypothetical protein [Caballeronia sp. S22]|uniref:hypothetical protein n=1 Tax=Caballeronia sp. S22 TaxID=3137182 RepID=UPI00353161FF
MDLPTCCLHTKQGFLSMAWPPSYENGPLRSRLRATPHYRAGKQGSMSAISVCPTSFV